MNSTNKTYFLSLVGLMSAVAFVSNYFSIPIGDVSRIHLGNGFCVLSGLLLGPVAGGLSAGLGAFFYDLTNPLYASEALITFCMKFVIGFVAGSIYKVQQHQGDRIRLFAAAIIASVTYIPIFLAKNFISQYYLYKNPIETVMVKLATRAVSSGVNAIAAVVVATLLLPVFLSAMKQSGMYERLYPGK